MKKTLGVAAIILCIAASAVFAQRRDAKAAGAFSKLQLIIDLFNARYGETVQLIRAGPKALPPATTGDASAERSLVEKDKAALAQWDIDFNGASSPSKIKDCRDTFSLARLASGYRTEWKPEDIPDFKRLVDRLVLIKAANALLTGNAAVCSGPPLFTDRFKSLWDSESSVSLQCLDLFYHFSFSKGLIFKSPGVRDSCTKLLTSENLIRGGDIAKVCEILISYGNRPQIAAAKLAGFFPNLRVGSERQAQVQTYVATLSGMRDESLCVASNPEFKGIIGLERCRASARIWKAHAAGNASPCGLSGLCRAVMGDLTAKAGYLEEAGKLFCERRTNMPASEVTARLQLKTQLLAKFKRDSEALGAKLAAIKGLQKDNSPEKQFQAAYLAQIKEMRRLIDDGMQFLASYEPKSDSHFEGWAERLGELQPRLAKLQQFAASKMKTKGAAPAPPGRAAVKRADTR